MDLKNQCKNLWLSTFSDTKEFVDFYFDRIFPKSLNYTIFSEENTLVATLQAIPFDIQTSGSKIKSAYLSGVATAEVYRGRGFMRNLLDKTHIDLMQKGYDCSFLIPAEEYLFDVYRKFGYQTMFWKDYNVEVVSKLTDENIDVVVFDRNMISKDLFDFFAEKSIAAGVLFSEQYFEVLLDAFLLEGSPIFVAYEAGKVVGEAFVSSSGVVLKIIARDLSVRQSLLRRISLFCDSEKVTIKSNERKIPYAMVKPLCSESIDIPDGASISLMLDE